VRYLGEELGKRYAERSGQPETISLTIRPRKIAIFDPMGG
jgi:hypothetical protein